MTKMLSEILETPSVLSRIEVLNAPLLEAFAKEFQRRKITHITFAARGTSDNASIYGQYLYTVVGGAICSLALCSAHTLYNASCDYSNDLVIGVSQSGSAEDVSSVIDAARASGAMTLAITNRRNSRLSNAAEFSLFCEAGEELSVAATKTFSSQLYLMLLSCAYAYGVNSLAEKARALPLEVSSAIEKIRTDIKEIAARFKDKKSGFVLARGLAYPLALETALKLQETSYMQMKGFATSDFWHGPLAQIEPECPVILYALKGKCLDSARELASKLVSIDAELLVVTDDESTAKEYASSYLIKSTDSEFTSPFLIAIFAQLLAEALSSLKGISPDEPRNLRKVTVTV